MTTNVTDLEAERIDAFLGNGTYDTWHGFDIEASTQLKRRKLADTVLWKVDHGFSVLSPYGTDLVEKLQNDCAWAIDLIKQEKFPEPEQFYPLLKLFPVALDAADLMLSYAEAIPTLWLVAGAAATPAVGFAAAAGRIHQELLELDELLREAQSEEIEAEIKSLLGIVITTVEIFVPGLGLLAKGGLTATEALLAGGTNTAAKSKYAKFTLESIEEVEKAGHTVQHVAKGGGKFLTISGYFFDIEEVLHAKGNVKKIKALLEKSNKEFKEIQGKITIALAAYQRFQRVIDTSQKAAWREIDEKRNERDDLITQTSYSIIKPVDWRLVADYSKLKR